MSDTDLVTRLDALERSNRRWRTIAVGVLCLGVGAVLGGFAAQPSTGQQPGAAAQPAAPKGPSVAGAVVTDDSSGQWGDTLLVVFDDGSISRLNTQGRPRWEQFQFSPQP